MSEQKFYCLCDDDSRHESMTKEQILSAIAQALETGTIEGFDGGFVTKVKELNSAGYVKFWVGTQTQYNALASIENDCFYIVSDSTRDDDIDSVINRISQALENHATNQSNPHNVTAAQVGATPASHAVDKNNPHGVTVAQIGAAPAHIASTEDIEAGVTELAPGTLYFVYVKG